MERMPHTPEILPNEESGHELSHEKAPTREALEAKHELAPKIEAIREVAEKEASRAEDIRLPQEEAPAEQAYVNKELKTMSYQRLLTRARKQLSPLDRPISRLIHQPVIESLSETASKTVGRPSGLIGGGTLAFVGTAVYYYLTKYYGYDYNYFVFLLLLLIGFAVGWFCEILFKVLRVRKSQ